MAYLPAPRPRRTEFEIDIRGRACGRACADCRSTSAPEADAYPADPEVHEGPRVDALS